MSRLARKNWTDDKYGIKSSGGVLDAMDNVVKVVARMTDDEYDYYCDIATDDEIGLLVEENLTFKQKRQLITLLTTKVYGRKV